MNETPSKNNDPADHLLLLATEMVGGGGIEAQEKAGQVQLVASDVLPTESLYGAREKLEAAGCVFGEPVEDDPLFTPVTLPPGWKKVGTEHDMWSSVVDDQGRERASIFYKAAFYDRKAHIMPGKDIS